MLTWTTTGIPELLVHLRQRRTTLTTRLATTLARTLDEGVTWARAHRLSGPRPRILDRRTGQLAQTFRQETQLRGRDVLARFGFLSPERPSWVGIHETGGVIRPRQAQFLTIPLGNTTGRARDYPDTFVRGRIIYERTASGAAVPRFLLTRQVTMPARPVMAPTWQRLEPLMIQRLTDVAGDV